MTTQNIIETYKCSACGEVKPSTEFYPMPRHNRRRQVAGYCVSCSKAKHQTWVDANQERVRKYRRKRAKSRPYLIKNNMLTSNHGITLAEYNRFYEQQNGRCAICLVRHPVLCVDHCHETENVRGLLCHSCNNGLGRFRDDIDRLRRAIQYLEASQC